MTPNWLGMLDELLADDSDRLSGWEVTFLESVNTQRQDDDWVPSKAQWKCLEKIWAKLNS